MSGNWYVAHLTSLNKKTGSFEVYCSKFGKKVQGKLPELIYSNYMLYDKVRVFIDVLPYTLRIKMLIKSKN